LHLLIAAAELAASRLVAQHLGATGVAEVPLAELSGHGCSVAEGTRAAQPLGQGPARDPRHGDRVAAAHRQLRAWLPVLAAHEAERRHRSGAERLRAGGEMPDVLAVAHQ